MSFHGHLHVARGIQRGSQPSILDHFNFVTTGLTQIGSHKKNHACRSLQLDYGGPFNEICIHVYSVMGKG